MALTVLSVAHPLAAVGPRAVGGAEQVLSMLDRALVEAGHRSIVIACEGSAAAGELHTVPLVSPPYDERARLGALERTRGVTRAVLERHQVDLVHLHAVDFPQLLPERGVPALITLHLPRAFYGPAAFHVHRPATWFNCVSSHQHRDYADLSASLLPPIENGVAIAPLSPERARARGGFALLLTRICEEKGVHHAIEAARLADVPLIIAGQVFAYPAHQRYFEQHVAPHLNPRCRFVGPVHGEAKRRLLSRARCLLLPSLVPETSSLVAREALACGTAVIAFDRGAPASLIEHGRTGYLVRDGAQMARAIADAHRIDPHQCLEAARRHGSLAAMTEGYLLAYARLAAPEDARCS